MKNSTEPQKKNLIRGFSHFSLFLLGMLFLSSNTLFAQQYFPIAEFIEENEVVEGDKVYNLIFGGSPTISISDGSLAYPSEDFPQCVHTDVSSIGSLGSENEKFRTVKAITIQLDDESGKSAVRLNPNSLKSFPNLHYIIIRSAVPLSEIEVRSMVSGFGEDSILVLYEYAVPV